jgi:2-polyprenyl-6-hydroxyphenyl methylase/3-demethylubiquinone-9 3-methyltransferase
LSEYYDRLELGEATTGYARAYTRRREVTLRLVGRAAGPGATVLDVAAAQGNLSLALAEEGYRVTWNDLREELVGYVRLKHERGAIEFMPGEIFHLQAVAHDVVVAGEIIEHVAHPDRFLVTLKNLVRPGGHLVLTTPNGAYVRNRLPKFSTFDDTTQFEAVQFRPDGDGHIFLLHPGELVGLAKRAGFEIVQTCVFSTPFTAGWLGTERLLPWIPDGDGVLQRLPAPLRERLGIHLACLLRRPGADGGPPPARS